MFFRLSPKGSVLSERKAASFEILHLICYPLIVLSTILTITFDWFAHKNEVLRYHGQAPGDFLTFRSYAILAANPRADVHIGTAFLYPPPFLLFALPVSWLPPAAGFATWVAASTLGFIIAARLIKLRWRAIFLGLIAPPYLFCAVVGQSGILVSSFLIAAFGLAGRAPALSGLAAGLLIIKPQFGLLIPVCYLASRNWRAGSAAAVTVLGLCLLSTSLFGPGIWRVTSIASAQSMLATPWPAEFQIQMITPLILFKSLFAGLKLAAILQACGSMTAIFACWHLWRQDLDMIDRLAPTLCLVALVTPYAYIYDLPALGVALAALALLSPSRGLVPFTLFLAFTSLYALLSVYLFSTGALFLVMILLMVWPYRLATELRPQSPFVPTSESRMI